MGDGRQATGVGRQGTGDGRRDVASVVVRADHVSRVFDMPSGDVVAVRDVSLDIAAGDYVAVQGPSGCGKSTLLHMLGCVDTPSK